MSKDASYYSKTWRSGYCMMIMFLFIDLNSNPWKCDEVTMIPQTITSVDRCASTMDDLVNCNGYESIHYPEVW